MKKIGQQDIQQELKKLKKSPAFEGLTLPFNSLDDRSFEILNYRIFQEKIKMKFSEITKKFDHVDLMQGVGEQGRDCILMKDQRNVGVIQCKRVASNITKPSFVQELLKFLIHSIIDSSLIDDINSFTYYISVSTGLAGTTKKLIREFNLLILQEEELEQWTNSVLKKYVAFKNLTFSGIEKQLKAYLSKIRIERILPEDLQADLNSIPQVERQFFKTKTVIDSSEIREILTEFLTPNLGDSSTVDIEKIEEFSVNFKEYLERSYKDYSSARTLVFGNQQKLLKDFYYPLELVSGKIRIKTTGYPRELLPIFKKVLIVDSGGMGKSTVMKWMFINAIRASEGIPIFIELRRLSKDNSLIDEIVNQINPLNKRISRQLLLDLIDKGNFIFFFDGYDEIRSADKSAVTKDITSFISKAAKNEFIITSRPDNIEGIFSDFRTFSIKPLTQPEAFRLIERLGNYNLRSLVLIKKIKENDQSNIKEFLKNPLLISLLYKKFEYRESIPLQKQEFYYEVFEALFKAHDLTKGTDYFIRPKKTNLKFNQFFQLLRIIGYKSIQENEVEFNKSVLTKLIREAKQELPKLVFEVEDFIDDITKAVPLFHKEGLKFRWSHKSIMEYFAAEFICIDTKEDQEKILFAIYNGSRFSNLNHVMDLCYDIDYKSFRNAVLYPFCIDVRDFFEDSFREMIESGLFELQKIRHRQFRLFLEDTYLISSNEVFSSSKDARKNLGKKVPGIRLLQRSSADNIYIGYIRKRDKERKLINLLRQKNDPIVGEILSRDFKYTKKSSGFRKSGIAIFPDIEMQDVIKITDNPRSLENDPKYFETVSLFLTGSTINYQEILKIIEETELDIARKQSPNSLTRGLE